MGREPNVRFDPRCKPNPDSKPLKTLLWWILLFASLLTLLWICYPDDAVGAEPTAEELGEIPSPASSTTYATQAQVEAYIKHFLRGVRVGKRWKGAEELSGLIVEHAAAPDPYWTGKPGKSDLLELEPIDPLLVAVNFSLESSFFQKRKGAVGELGLPQIHPRNIRALTKPDGTLYDMEKREDQVAAGVRHLAYELQRCKSLEQTFTAYKHGGCKPVRGVGPYRAKQYRKARRIVGLE